jgi:hypothetical protein
MRSDAKNGTSEMVPDNEGSSDMEMIDSEMVRKTQDSADTTGNQQVTEWRKHQVSTSDEDAEYHKNARKKEKRSRDERRKQDTDDDNDDDDKRSHKRRKGSSKSRSKNEPDKGGPSKSKNVASKRSIEHSPSFRSRHRVQAHSHSYRRDRSRSYRRDRSHSRGRNRSRSREHRRSRSRSDSRSRHRRSPKHSRHYRSRSRSKSQKHSKAHSRDSTPSRSGSDEPPKDTKEANDGKRKKLPPPNTFSYFCGLSNNSKTFTILLKRAYNHGLFVEGWFPNMVERASMVASAFEKAKKGYLALKLDPDRDDYVDKCKFQSSKYDTVCSQGLRSLWPYGRCSPYGMDVPSYNLDTNDLTFTVLQISIRTPWGYQNHHR